DLKTFAAIGVHGTSAITCLTAQNPREVRSVEPASAKMARDQVEAVFAELPPRAVKTGMLYSAELITAVCEPLRARRSIPLIVDPVMIATSGDQLLREDAVAALKERLLPLASLITPNVAEAGFLLKRSLKSLEDLRRAARELYERHGCGALVKGGHLRGVQAVDFYYDGVN